MCIFLVSRKKTTTAENDRYYGLKIGWSLEAFLTVSLIEKKKVNPTKSSFP